MSDGMNYIAGQWLPGEGVFYAENPAKGERIERPFHQSTVALVDKAARAAAACAAEFASMPPKQRAAFLRAAAEEIDARGDAITAAGTEETGLPEQRLIGERGRTVGQLHFFADWIEEGSWLGVRIDHADPDRQPLPRPDLRTMRKALGPVAVFGASNFPLAFSVAGGDSASAWAAGCPVVHKAHSAHPRTAELVAEAVAAAVEKTGMPAGIFSLLQGGSREAGAALVQHPAIKAVGFTGSLGGGRALHDLAASRPEPIPFYGELGSTNPVFLLPGALETRAEQTAEQWAASVTMGCGQFCTNPGVLVVLKGDGVERFVEIAKGKLSEVAESPMLNTRIAEGYAKSVAKMAAETGITTVVAPAAKGAPCHGSPALFRTTAKAYLASGGMKDEMFGPAAILVVCEDDAEMARVAEGAEGQLTATVHMENTDAALAGRLRPILEDRAGRVLVNGFPTGVEVSHSMVHGGPYPASTNGATTSVGSLAIERFTRPVSYQNLPDALLPPALQEANPLGVPRLVDGRWER